MGALPDLSRFELQCLRRLWQLEEASTKEIQDSFDDSPGYSTVRKILERLEEKGAVRRVGRRGRAWVYRSTVSQTAMIRKEVRRLLDSVFDGAAGSLVAHLAEMKELSMEDLRELEKQLAPRKAAKRTGR